MRAADLDGNNYIDYAEFRAATISLFGESSLSPYLDQAFDFFDKDSCDSLTASDFLESINTSKMSSGQHEEHISNMI
jgi:Ca2+-binding EF-hand superfamily protein